MMDAHPDLAEPLPKLALSIMQPWAWCIVGPLQKPVENRDWKPHNLGLKFRGPVAIHAGKQFDREPLADLSNHLHPVTGERLGFDPWAAAGFEAMALGHRNGGIVGVAEVVEVVTAHPSPWFVGPYGLVLAHARPVPFVPVKGALGFFDWRKGL